MLRRVLRLLAPLGDLVNGFHIRIGRPRMAAIEYRRVLSYLRPGDVILSKESWRPTNLLIRGRLKHAAIFVGDGVSSDDSLIEAAWPKVRHTTLVEVWQYASDIVVLRPQFTDSAGAHDAAKQARELVGTPYDSSFAHGEEALYCSELIDAAYDGALSTLRSDHLSVEDVILPDTLRTSSLFRVVWDSAS